VSHFCALLSQITLNGRYIIKGSPVINIKRMFYAKFVAKFKLS